MSTRTVPSIAASALPAPTWPEPRKVHENEGEDSAKHRPAILM
jgi:hypothetical protein